MESKPEIPPGAGESIGTGAPRSFTRMNEGGYKGAKTIAVLAGV